MRLTVTPELVAQIRQLRLVEHLPLPEITKRLGVNYTMVQDYAPVSAKPIAHWDEVLGLLQKGVPQATIWRELKMPQGQVSRIARRAVAEGLLPQSALGQHARRPKSNGAAPSGAPASVKDTTDRTVIKVANEITRDSLRTRLLRRIAENGPWADVNVLIADLRGVGDNWDGHEVQHILRELNRNGLIKFRQNKRGTHVVLEHIQATTRGLKVAGLALPSDAKGEASSRTAVWHPESKTADSRADEIVREIWGEHLVRFPEHHHAPLAREAVTTAVEAPSSSTPAIASAEGAPTPAGLEAVEEGETLSFIRHKAEQVLDYPLLNVLQHRRTRANQRAKLLERAADLAETDEERNELTRLGIAALEVHYEPLEAEYLRFVEDHHGTPEP